MGVNSEAPPGAGGKAKHAPEAALKGPSRSQKGRKIKGGGLDWTTST